MKKIISVFSLLCALFFIACGDKSEVESHLSLSTSLVEVEKEATTVKVIINTNEDVWSYTIPQQLNWFSIEKQGEELSLTFTENTTNFERSTVILVRANDALQRLVIKQKGNTPEFTMDTSEIIFSSLAEEKVINLGAGVKNAQVEKLDDISWLSLRQITNSTYSLRVDDQPEIDSQERKTKIIITVGNLTKEVQIVQQAHKYYMLPIIRPQLNLQTMISEEEKRGSQLIRVPGGNNLRFYQFAVNAREGKPGFIQYDYPFAEEEVFFKASLIYKGRDRFEGDNDGLNTDFVAFMKSEGFDRIDRDAISEALSVRIPAVAIGFFEKIIPPLRFVAYTSRINENGADTRLDIIHETATNTPNTPENEPGFTSLPLADKLPWIGSKAFSKPAGKKKNDVTAYEQGLGSRYNEKNSGVNSDISSVFFSSFDVTPTPQTPEYVRGYLTLLPGKYWVQGLDLTLAENDPAINDVEGILALYENLGLVFSNYEQNIDKRTIKNSVKQMFKENGYPYLKRFTDGTDVFFNKKTKLAFVISPFDDTTKNKKVLRIRIVYANF